MENNNKIGVKGGRHRFDKKKNKEEDEDNNGKTTFQSCNFT